jgi:hypothetical protein
MTMRTTMLLVGLVAGLAGSAVFAQDMDPDAMGGPHGMGAGMMPDFATLDADGDGLVMPAEVEAQAAARFAAADADVSGGLSVAEMVAMAEAARLEAQTARATERLAGIDDNADGEVQAAELAARMPQQEVMFDMFDADNDGSISQAEFDASMGQMAEHRGARDGMGHRGMNHDGMRGDRDGGGWWFWNRSNG